MIATTHVVVAVPLMVATSGSNDSYPYGDSYPYDGRYQWYKIATPMVVASPIYPFGRHQG